MGSSQGVMYPLVGGSVGEGLPWSSLSPSPSLLPHQETAVGTGRPLRRTWDSEHELLGAESVTVRFPAGTLGSTHSAFQGRSRGTGLRGTPAQGPARESGAADRHSVALVLWSSPRGELLVATVSAVASLPVQTRAGGEAAAAPRHGVAQVLVTATVTGCS